MKTVKRFLLIIIGVMCFASCTNPNKSAKNTIDWTGVYTNILPCADCEGIETTIELMSDQTFVMQTNYLQSNDNSNYNFTGQFYWEKGGNQIALKIDDSNFSAPNKYIVKENKLIQLDMNGKEITDSNFDYSLEKISDLIGKKWSLTQMNGNKIEIDNEFLKRPQLVINSDYKVNGVGTCNTFFGKAFIRSGNKIEFSALASTMMACLNMIDVEHEYFTTFDKVKKYSINNNNILNLYSANDELLLTFVLVEE